MIKVQAIDPDIDSDLEYTLVDVRAIDTAGIPISQPTIYNYNNFFR